MALVWGYTFDFTGLANLLTGADAGQLMLDSGWTKATVNNPQIRVLARARQPSAGYGGSAYALNLEAQSYFGSHTTSVKTPSDNYSLADGVVSFHTEIPVLGDDVYYSLHGGGTELCRVIVKATRLIEVWTGVPSLTLRATGSLSVPTTACYMAIRFKTGASGQVDVAIDGTSITTGTINVGTTTSWDQVEFFSTTASTWIWMPTVWDDPATDTTLLATKWVARIAPSADSVAGGWVGSSGGTITADIDELQFSATDYASTTTDPDEFLCDVSSTASIDANWTPGAIHGVASYSVMRGEGGLNSSQNAVKSGSTTVLSTAVTNTTTSKIRSSVQVTDPNTASAWANKAAIDAATFGVKAS